MILCVPLKVHNSNTNNYMYRTQTHTSLKFVASSLTLAWTVVLLFWLCESFVRGATSGRQAALPNGDQPILTKASLFLDLYIITVNACFRRSDIFLKRRYFTLLSSEKYLGLWCNLKNCRININQFWIKRIFC